MSPASTRETVAPPPQVAAGLWSLLWALYTTQFIGASFISTGLTGILRSGGVDLAMLGLLQLLGLIWPLKILWAPLVDRWSPAGRLGHHRAWLMLLQSLMVLSLLGLGLIGDPVTQLGPVAVLAGLFVLFSATQDIAADALSVRQLPEDRHDDGAGVQVAASYVGTVIGGGLALVMHDQWGWRAAVVLLAICTAAAMIPVLRSSEPRREDHDRARVRFRDLVGVLAQPGARLWGLVAIPLVAMGSAGMWSLVTPILTDAGWSLSRIGLTTSVLASIPALGAGLLAGRLMGRRGRAPIMGLGAGVQLLGGLLLLPLVLGSGSSAMAGAAAVVGACLILAGYTVLNAGMYAVNLDLARPDHAGTDFTLLSSLNMLAGTIGAWAGLTVAAFTGYPVSLLLGLAVAVAGILTTRRHQRIWGRAARRA